jgi:cytochrome c556
MWSEAKSSSNCLDVSELHDGAAPVHSRRIPRRDRLSVHPLRALAADREGEQAPIAETKLLMEGLVSPNLNALGKLLADKPPDAEAWGFARGQALLIAESGNLLLLRPPKSAAGEEAWMKHAMELRDAAAALARAAAAKDYDRSRVWLAGVANTCNRCHQTFRVPKRIDPFTQE